MTYMYDRSSRRTAVVLKTLHQPPYQQGSKQNIMSAMKAATEQTMICLSSNADSKTYY